MKKHLHITVTFFLVLNAFTVLAQQAQRPASLKNYTDALTAYRQTKPIEKLYLQTDKSYYNAGDTLRFKGYLLNADFLRPALASGLLYVELDDESGKSTRRIMVPVISGMAWGDIALDSTEVPDGSYTLRAYTNWMRNFAEDYVFKKDILIARSAYNPLLVKANFKQNGSKMEGELQFTLLDGRIPAFKDVELKVINGKRNLSKDKVTTDAAGIVKVNFTLPENDNGLSMEALTAGNDRMKFPIGINRKENTDLQFMPEGGQLVAGLPTKVGFKAIGEDGKGVSVTGRILDSKGTSLGSFSSAYGGMGHFTITPAIGEVYFVKLDGIIKTYALPTVKQGGTTLAVSNAGKDSLQITLSATNDVKGTCFLIAQSRGLVCYAQTVGKLPQSRLIAKSVFPTGIVRFSLINTANQPVNERIVFINHQDNMGVYVTPQKGSYSIRDSIALAINVTDKEGKPVEGNFSIAVTDDSQVKPDSLGSNLLTHMLLTSDLKGHIENPAYYFNSGKETELDNLMLTQGWVGYNWKDVLQPSRPPLFKPEAEFTVSGKVTNFFGKPVDKANVLLISTQQMMFKDTITNKEGRFVFKDMFPIDTAIFKLQARTKRNKESVGLKVDEMTAPVFAPMRLGAPWYLNTDTTLLNNSKTKLQETQALSNYLGEGNVLNEANIRAKKIIPESKNLNGPGEADQIIDENELKRAGKITLLDLLQQKIPGFNVGSYTPPGREYPMSFMLPSYLIRDYPQLSRAQAEALASKLTTTRPRPHMPWRLTYRVYAQELHFIIDGIDLDYFFDSTDETIHVVPGSEINIRPNDTQRLRFVKSYLEYFTAEDITGIEMMRTKRYAGKYDQEFDKYMDRMGNPSSVAYLEITTRAKKGPFMQVTPGTYLYRALPYTLAKQFYSPKYTVTNKGARLGTDLRSTIFWEPNVVTDKQGKASIVFYSADKPANYTVIIEGTDMGGQLGFGKQTIKVSR